MPIRASSRVSTICADPWPAHVAGIARTPIKSLIQLCRRWISSAIGSNAAPCLAVAWCGTAGPEATEKFPRRHVERVLIQQAAHDGHRMGAQDIDRDGASDQVGIVGA